MVYGTPKPILFPQCEQDTSPVSDFRRSWQDPLCTQTMAFSQVCLLGRPEFASVTWFRSVKKPSTYCRDDCFVAWGREKKLSQQSGGRAVVCKDVTAGLPLPTPQRTGGDLICRPPTGCPVEELDSGTRLLSGAGGSRLSGAGGSRLLPRRCEQLRRVSKAYRDPRGDNQTQHRSKARGLSQGVHTPW